MRRASCLRKSRSALKRPVTISVACWRFSTSKTATFRDSGSDCTVLDIHDRQHPFYNATFGRWLYNEKAQLAERHRYFNIDTLCGIVADSVNQSSNDILRFTKIAEGGSYRVFDVLFKDQRNVIVRLPYPSTLPHNHRLASEVATLEYLRLRGLPVPKVLSWSSTNSNPLGCEYIVMERAQGTCLDEIWYTMNAEMRKSALKSIVDMEAFLFGTKFPVSGSLYFKNLLPEHVKSVDIPGNTQFCVGPSTEVSWWDEERDELPVNKGPWNSTLDLLESVGQRELQWLQQFGQPRYPREPLYRELYNNEKVDPTEQIANLRSYLEVAPYIVPGWEELNEPTIRHPDLSPSNIFVDESGKVTSIIDWERTAILPMFIQARAPKHFQNFGDEESENFKLPPLPDDFDSLSNGKKEEQMELYRRRHVHYYYLGFTSRVNPIYFRALGTPGIILRNQLYDAAGRPWEGDTTSLKAQVINLSLNWSRLETSPNMPKPDFPIAYTEDEMKSCLAKDAEQKEVDDQMQTFRDHFGCSIDGWVPAGMYAEAKQKAHDMKAYTMQIAETEAERREIDELWPFQGHEENPYIF